VWQAAVRPSTCRDAYQRQRPEGVARGADRARGVERREDERLGRVGRVLQDAAGSVAVALEQKRGRESFFSLV
jgi:hypothetical protein